MTRETQNRFSGPVTVFHERRLPERATPAGYAALIDAYGLKIPIPITLSAIGERHKRTEQDNCRIFGPRYSPGRYGDRRIWALLGAEC